ncbi:hypothetical protein [Maribacter luteus]|uniref:DUF1593 domain-containing protein n=1 Tax=Maribacter luteus TaxID=2594478 RepID=A0A6I2MNA1_9FLAO|nr:hypothetical protein [Maribacter luteus]MRX65323.1 hypothetical protein [Maribacter luteus]
MNMNLTYNNLILILLGMFCFIGKAQTIPYTQGRIVISSDGNEHDHDDWAATPFSLALIAAKGLQDSLTVYTFSDHIWGSNHEKTNGKEEMLISALEGKKVFNFENSSFIEAVEHPKKAIRAITDEINKSNQNSPLYIIAAGPMHVVGSAIEKADPSKLKFVRLISHSNWNNDHANKPYDWEQHTGWTWDGIKDKFEPMGLVLDRIVDQNGGKDYEGMKAPREMFDWIKTSPVRKDSSQKEKQLDWLYQRQLTCIKKGEFDPSDAGMVIYLLTGKQKTSPNDAKEIIEHRVRG